MVFFFIDLHKDQATIYFMYGANLPRPTIIQFLLNTASNFLQIDQQIPIYAYLKTNTRKEKVPLLLIISVHLSHKRDYFLLFFWEFEETMFCFPSYGA